MFPDLLCLIPVAAVLFVICTCVYVCNSSGTAGSILCGTPALQLVYHLGDSPTLSHYYATQIHKNKLTASIYFLPRFSDFS